MTIKTIRSKCTGNTALMGKTRKVGSIFVRTRLVNRSSRRRRKRQRSRPSGWELNDAGNSGFGICGISQTYIYIYIYIYATEQRELSKKREYIKLSHGLSIFLLCFLTVDKFPTANYFLERNSRTSVLMEGVVLAFV